LYGTVTTVIKNGSIIVTLPWDDTLEAGRAKAIELAQASVTPKSTANNTMFLLRMGRFIGFFMAYSFPMGHYPVLRSLAADDNFCFFRSSR
jgi:hypothetical protein